jgi:hypothetical protein
MSAMHRQGRAYCSSARPKPDALVTLLLYSLRHTHPLLVLLRRLLTLLLALPCSRT